MIEMTGDADAASTRALMNVMGGHSEQITVANGAEMTLVQNTYATDHASIVSQGGILAVKSTCVSTDCLIQGGKQNINNGGLAIGTTITSGEQQVWKNGTASNTYIKNGNLRLENADAIAENVRMENGSILLGNGSILRNAIMEGGSLTKAGYSSAFTIENLTMLPGSNATIYSGSTLLGDFYLSGNMDLTGRIVGQTISPVHASEANFWFSLENLDGTGNTAIVKSSIVQDEMATCYVTVSGEQASGLYILAEGNEDFLNSLNSLPASALPVPGRHRNSRHRHNRQPADRRLRLQPPGRQTATRSHRQQYPLLQDHQ
jgi:autotransporter passenger strand-loop-strand repeat protein